MSRIITLGLAIVFAISSLLVFSLLVGALDLQTSAIKYGVNIPTAAAQPSVEGNSSSSNNITNVTDSASRDNRSTFLAVGTINQIVPIAMFDEEPANEQQSLFFLLGGDWLLSVKDGQIRDFTVQAKMVAEDGTQFHYHTIHGLSNATSQASPLGINDTAVEENIVRYSGDESVVFSGFGNITTNGVTQWENVALTIGIAKGNVVSILPNPGAVDHFYGLPIYGIVTSVIDSSGQQLKTFRAEQNATAFHGKGEVSLYDNGTSGVINNNSETGEDFLNGGNEPQQTLAIPYPDESIESPLLQSNQTEIPIVEKLSDQENYLVQLRWSQSPILPLPGINYQLFFLDPDQPHATEEIVPPWESNFTSLSRLNVSGYIEPEILLYFALAESYDITVYSNDGGVLWQKDDVPIYGGRSQGLITFENEYRGPITVEITDIKSFNGSQGNQTITPDSVRFTSLVVVG